MTEVGIFLLKPLLRHFLSLHLNELHLKNLAAAIASNGPDLPDRIKLHFFFVMCRRDDDGLAVWTRSDIQYHSEWMRDNSSRDVQADGFVAPGSASIVTST
jgi:hypothetical protein